MLHNLTVLPHAGQAPVFFERRARRAANLHVRCDYRATNWFNGLALKVTVTISVTFWLGVNDLFTFLYERKEAVMFFLSALVAYVWFGVAFLWRPGGSLLHARGGIEGGAVSWSKRDVREVRFLPSTPSPLHIAPNS